MSLETCKKAAAEKAASFITDGMIVGLGTGTTTSFFIEKLIQRCKAGLKIKAVASSERSLNQARSGGIPLIDINTLKNIDIYIDGADEIDPEKRMIKGAGGALVREKIAANMSQEMVVIADESKLVQKLGRRPLPVEIIPFGYGATLHKLQLLGYPGDIRRGADNSPYITDNHNLIYDIRLNPETMRPAMDHEQILSVPGVVDTGFFLNLAGRIVVGFLDGRVIVQ
jgi:ribose 5-phosphate isomerase A